MANTLETSGSAPGLNQFLPGAVPTDFDERNAFLNYRREAIRL